MKMIFNRQLLKEKRNFAASFLMQENTAKVFHDAADLIMDSLEILDLNPLNTLELGARSGICSAKLQDFYPNSAITATDISPLLLVSNPIKRQILCDDETFYLNADKKFDLVIANIFANTIIELYDYIVKKQPKVIIMSGFFEDQIPNILKRYQEQYMTLNITKLNKWATLSLQCIED